MYENKAVLAVNTLHPVEHIAIQASSTRDAIQILNETCSGAGLPLPKILASTYENSALRMMIYGDADLLNSFYLTIKDHQKIKDLQIKACAVSMSGPGVGQQKIIEESLVRLENDGVQALKILNSPRTLTFIVKSTDQQKAAQSLHSLWLEGGVR